MKVERFALVTAPGSGAVGTQAPTLIVKGKKARKVAGNRVVVRGSAAAFGSQNQIAKVEYRLGGAGSPSKARSFRKAKGRESWKIVLEPIDGNFRIKVRAVDLTGQRSAFRTVRVVDTTP